MKYCIVLEGEQGSVRIKRIVEDKIEDRVRLDGMRGNGVE